MFTLLHQLSAWSAALFDRKTATCPRCGGITREHMGWAENMMICQSCGHEEISD